MEMHLRLSVKTNCRIFKELTRPLSRAHAMSSAISLEIALLMTRCDTGCVGGASRDRTDDLRVANATLSQLSYGPSLHWPKSSRRFRRTSLRRPRAKSVVFARYAGAGKAWHDARDPNIGVVGL